MIDKTCETCGSAFQVKPYRSDTARFCSGSCRATWVCSLPHNHGPKPRMIGNKLRAGLPPTNAFKPAEVRGDANPKWVPSVALTCERCGQAFERKPWEIRRNAGTRFCSRACFQASACFLAERSVTYLGGPTTVRGPNWRSIRAAVVAEQDGNCGHCGKHVGNRMPVHHIRPFRDFATADEANVRTNLIGLCGSCHAKADRNLEKAIHAQRAPEQRK
jgi:5-methylcytosine-specific restriction endonuclease McrA